MNPESVGKIDFVIGGFLVSVCSPSIDQPQFSGLSFPAGKQSVWRAKEAEHIGCNKISAPIGYCLTTIELLFAFY